MEIQVGEYIRTLDGIKKIVKINEGKLSTYYGKYIVFPEYKNSKSINVKNIIKHSFNIIDLIEKGDFVNGQRVEEKHKDGIFLENMQSFYEEKEIETIVTKEQFEAMEYEVK